MSTKISQLTSATDVTANDLIQIVDVEDGVMAPSGTNKKATASLLAKELAKQPLEPGVVISGSSSGDAVRITQTGTGNALVVEDSTNPDTTPTVITSSGSIGIGISNPLSKLHIEGGDIRTSGDYIVSGSGSLKTSEAGLGVAIWSAGSDGVAFESGLTPIERMRITFDGKVGIGTSDPGSKLNVVDNSANDAVRITQTGSGNALVVEDSANPDANPIVIDSNGVVISGNTTAASVYNIYTTGQLKPKIQIQGFSADASSFGVFQSQDGIASGLVSFAKSRGTVVSPTAAQAGDLLGVYSFQGHDGTGYQEGARLAVVVDQAVVTGDVSAAFSFITNPSGGGQNSAERMRITSSGNVGIGTSTPNASCLLDISSTSRGFRPPSMTTGQRDLIASPVAGVMIYNTTTNKLNFHNGSAWEAVTSAV